MSDDLDARQYIYAIKTLRLCTLDLIKVGTCRTLHLKAVCAIKGADEKPLNCGFVHSQGAETVLQHSEPRCSAVKLFIRLCQVQKQKCCNAKIHKAHESRRENNRQVFLRQHNPHNTETRTTRRALALLLRDRMKTRGSADPPTLFKRHMSETLGVVALVLALRFRVVAPVLDLYTCH